MDATTDSDIEPVSPIVCTLTTKAAARQALEWSDLQHRARAVGAIDGGVRMTLPAAILADVEDLARREAGCCTFLTFTTTVVGDTLTLDITSANPAALPVITALSGLATQ